MSKAIKATAGKQKEPAYYLKGPLSLDFSGNGAERIRILKGRVFIAIAQMGYGQMDCLKESLCQREVELYTIHFLEQ